MLLGLRRRLPQVPYSPAPAISASDRAGRAWPPVGTASWAVLGVRIDEKETVVKAGVASLRTGTPVTADTLFLIGSITKLFTPALVLQFVDAAPIGLDDPITTHLPDRRSALTTPSDIRSRHVGVARRTCECIRRAVL